MEVIGYVFLGIVALCWLAAIFIGMIAAFPFGIFGFLVIIGIGFLFAKVVKDRLESAEDDHYSKNVDI